MSRPVHFEIHADDPERAIEFYETALGWTFKHLEGRNYWLIATGPADQAGINGGLRQRQGAPPSADAAGTLVGFLCTVEVRDLDTHLKAVSNAGGSIVTGKHAVPGVGWIAYARDTEGNIFGLSQADPTAM